MTYSKGNESITIEINHPLFGKRPELYIGTGNQLLKVASFANERKAELFVKQLEYFFGDLLEKEKKDALPT